LTYALTVAEERTRTRIAAGLHDDVGQLLTMMRLRLRALLDGAPDPGTAARAQEIEVMLDEAARLVRSVTFELTSPVLQQLGLAAAIESLGPRVEQHGGPRFHFGDRASTALDQDAQGVLFRIVRELLANVRAHAHARNARVDLSASGDIVTITVSDDGIGFDMDPTDAACTPSGGYGLYSSLAQVHGLGGTLCVRRGPSGGTTVEIRVPQRSPEPINVLTTPTSMVPHSRRAGPDIARVSLPSRQDSGWR
jgi:signal transduction histidine kinase